MAASGAGLLRRGIALRAPGPDPHQFASEPGGAAGHESGHGVSICVPDRGGAAFRAADPGLRAQFGVAAGVAGDGGVHDCRIWSIATTSPGIVVFPLVFRFDFCGGHYASSRFWQVSPGMRRGWLFVHIAMIFIGYAALFLSFAASLLYLLQERSLKSKKPSRDAIAPARSRGD